MKLRFFKTSNAEYINICEIVYASRNKANNTLAIEFVNGKIINLSGEDADHLEAVLDDYVAFECK